jgi:hypothetical protein
MRRKAGMVRLARGTLNGAARALSDNPPDHLMTVRH